MIRQGDVYWVDLVSQLFTVDKDELVEKIGSLAADRVQQIFAGLGLLLTPRGLE